MSLQALMEQMKPIIEYWSIQFNELEYHRYLNALKTANRYLRESELNDFISLIFIECSETFSLLKDKTQGIDAHKLITILYRVQKRIFRDAESKAKFSEFESDITNKTQKDFDSIYAEKIVLEFLRHLQESGKIQHNKLKSKIFMQQFLSSKDKDTEAIHLQLNISKSLYYELLKEVKEEFIKYVYTQDFPS